MRHFKEYGIFRRILHVLRTGLLVVFAYPSLAGANCSDFPDLEQLLRFSWHIAERDQIGNAEYARINTFLSASELDDMTPVFESTGHSGAQTAVSLLIENLRIITTLGLSSRPDSAQKFARGAGFVATRNNAFQAYQILCHDGGVPHEDMFPGDVPDTGSDGTHTRLSAASPGSPRSDATDAKITTWAFRIVGIWLVTTLGLLSVHFGLIALTSRKRVRHFCKVPAILDIAGQVVPGHVTILGRLGNRFEPEADAWAETLKGFETGMYCTLGIDGKTLAAKTMSSEPPCLGMLFSEPLEPEEVFALLEGSLTKPKPDRSVTSATGTGRYRFGKGRLVTVKQSS